jgi:hypothetical protein
MQTTPAVLLLMKSLYNRGCTDKKENQISLIYKGFRTAQFSCKVIND